MRIDARRQYALEHVLDGEECQAVASGNRADLSVVRQVMLAPNVMLRMTSSTIRTTPKGFRVRLYTIRERSANPIFVLAG